MIIGLTGGIGSGKSTVAKMFKKLGVPVYDSDKRAKKLMVTSKKLRKGITDLFGEESYQGKTLNNAFLADQVFKNKALLEKLNGLVHPAVKDDFKKWQKRQESPYVIQETALIYENQMQRNYDRVILVTSPQAERVKRVVARDGLAADQVHARIKNQLDDTHKIPLADYVIENELLEETNKMVIQIHEKLLKLVATD